MSMKMQQFKCRVCRQHFEARTSDPDEERSIACPKCGSTETEKAEAADGISATLFPSLGGRFT
jgi:putative FmdB family regulatory protein